MKVIHISNKSGYSRSNNKFMNFERFANQAGDFVLIEGGFEQVNQWDQFGFSKDELLALLKKKIVRLEFEEPNKFFLGDNPDTYDHYFYKIFTLCPYTASWLNKRQGNKKHIPIYYPFNEEFIPKKVKKQYDIMYAGHIVSKKLLRDLQTISKFNYRFISNSPHPLVTNRNASHMQKLHLSAQSRITLVHNVLYPKPYHLFNIWKTPRYQENEAFKMVPKPYQIWKWIGNENIFVPQLKARLFEAAFTRSVILCRYEPFNLIEKYFKPNEEFIYFREGELEEKITEILADYSKYEKIAERAYRRAVANYTTKAFFKKYLKNLK